MLSVLPALAAPRDAAVSAAVTGADVGSQQPSIAWEAPAKMNADLDAMVAAGMTWVRADFYWSAIELQRGKFSWAATDAFVARGALARTSSPCDAGLHAGVGSLGSDRQVPAENPVDYATFVGKLAARYAPMGVHAWEIWNEPNVSVFWAPRPTRSRIRSC